MKPSLWQIFIATVIAFPLLFYIGGLSTWALGIVLGEILGTVSFVWVGLTVRQSFSKASINIRRKLLAHSMLRYLLLGSIFFLAIKWPGVEIWAVVIGYTLIQLPAAILRALYG